MPLRRLPLVLLIAAFGVIGCRDALVDEPLPPNAEEPGEQTRSIYLKGPEVLRNGATGSYRAEPVPGAVRYDWSRSGTGDVTGTPTDEIDRLYDITGTVTGTVELQVIALDENGGGIGFGSKVIEVVP